MTSALDSPGEQLLLFLSREPPQPWDRDVGCDREDGVAHGILTRPLIHFSSHFQGTQGTVGGDSSSFKRATGPILQHI